MGLAANLGDNLVHHNNFVDTGLRPYDDTGSNKWDDGAEGNYWSDYTGDGSTPYIIPLLGMDRRPLVAPIAIPPTPIPPVPPVPIPDLHDKPQWRITADTLIQDQTVEDIGSIFIENGGSLTLRNVTLLRDGVTDDIIVEEGGALFIYNSRIAPSLPETGGYLFQVMPNTMFVIENSELSGVGRHPGCGDWAGLWVLTSNAVIENNVITNSYCGLSLSGGNHKILNNRISYCETGISTNEGSNNLLMGNAISKCLAQGIIIGGEGQSTIEDNSISSIRGWAILNYAHDSKFVNNVISYSHGGIDTYGSNNKVYRNTFISNRIQAYEHGGTQWDYEGQGNYWNDYIGVDANGDGVGDTPYSIFPNGIDNYPLMSPTVVVPPISVAVTPVSLPSSGVAAGDTNIALIKIKLEITPSGSSQIASWVGIRIDRTGTVEDNDVSAVEIWSDTDGNEKFNADLDIEIASGNFSNGTMTITFPSFEDITPRSQAYFIVFDISDRLSDPSSTVGVRFADSSYFKFLYPAEVSATNFPFESEQLPVPVLEVTLDVPKTFALGHNYPNPFNPETTIKYQLPKSTEVKLEVYNILGQRIATLMDEKQQAGYYSVKWGGRNDLGKNVGTGIYIYRLESKEFVKARKLALLR